MFCFIQGYFFGGPVIKNSAMILRFNKKINYREPNYIGIEYCGLNIGCFKTNRLSWATIILIK